MIKRTTKEVEHAALAALESLRHILDETGYRIDEKQGSSKEQFLHDATIEFLSRDFQPTNNRASFLR